METLLAADTATLEDFLEKYPIRSVKKGQTVVYQGEAPRHLLIVKSGVVKTYNINAHGEEKILTFSVAKDILTPAWFFGRSQVALFYYDAFTDCELYSLPREDLHTFLDHHIEIYKELLDRYATLYVGATMHINALEQSKSVDKIIHTLQHLIMRYGEEQGKGLWRINLRLTHQDFANMIGLTRETIATELSKLKRKGIVSYFGQRYLVRADLLQQMLGEDNFYNINVQ